MPADSCCEQERFDFVFEIAPLSIWHIIRRLFLEEDKQATTNVQNGLVFLFLFSFKKALILRKVLGEISGKDAEKCEKV